MSRYDATPESSVLLTPVEMAMADRLANETGTSGEVLMRRAGAAVARAAQSMARGGPVAVLAGSGNNGGDAFAAARRLHADGIDVTVFAGVDRHRLQGDAARMALEWTGDRRSLHEFDPSRFGLVVDGLFGAGLSRDVEGAERTAIEAINAYGAIDVLAIDLPSGVSGLDGSVRGVALKANRTVTFFRRKPGHLLQPGRSLCGRLEVADIGIDPSVLGRIASTIFANEPGLFAPFLLRPEDTHHKYDRGHAVVFSGPSSKTGAARLSAMAALRGGAGLVTVFSPAGAMQANAIHLTAIMLQRCEDDAELSALLEDHRLGTFVIGPGFSDREKARRFVKALCRTGRRIVLDADALTAFAEEPEVLFGLLTDAGSTVLTPHDGEFKRLFPALAPIGSKLDRAREAARISHAVVVLKGSDTVIASPDGRAAINGTGSADLATAGTGDVLSGLVAAQLANGVESFEAACAAVWLHARAAATFGPGLIAEDLPGLVPGALRALRELS